MTPRSRKLGAKSLAKTTAIETVGGADRKIEILVDDDEGHPDRDDPDTGGIAQQRVKGFRRAEKGRVDESAAEIEQYEEEQQPSLPAAGRAEAARGRTMLSWTPWSLPINLAVTMRRLASSRIDFRRFR